MPQDEAKLIDEFEKLIDWMNENFFKKAYSELLLPRNTCLQIKLNNTNKVNYYTTERGLTPKNERKATEIPCDNCTEEQKCYTLTIIRPKKVQEILDNLMRYDAGEIQLSSLPPWWGGVATPLGLKTFNKSFTITSFEQPKKHLNASSQGGGIFSSPSKEFLKAVKLQHDRGRSTIIMELTVKLQSWETDPLGNLVAAMLEGGPEIGPEIVKDEIDDAKELFEKANYSPKDRKTQADLVSTVSTEWENALRAIRPPSEGEPPSPSPPPATPPPPMRKSQTTPAVPLPPLPTVAESQPRPPPPHRAQTAPHLRPPPEEEPPFLKPKTNPPDQLKGDRTGGTTKKLRKRVTSTIKKTQLNQRIKQRTRGLKRKKSRRMGKKSRRMGKKSRRITKRRI